MPYGLSGLCMACRYAYSPGLGLNKLKSVQRWRMVKNESHLFGIQSVNSQGIVRKFGNHYYLVKFRELSLSISKVRPFDM